MVMALMYQSITYNYTSHLYEKYNALFAGLGTNGLKGNSVLVYNGVQLHTSLQWYTIAHTCKGVHYCAIAHYRTPSYTIAHVCKVHTVAH